MSFAENLAGWQRVHGRRNLPWQGTRDPYRIWLSEVMLQQTQVSAVIPYYERFLAKYPTVEALAAASEDEVLQLWSGLGYYARGRNLHKAAVHISRNGFPNRAESIAELPGVGRSTAAAIAVFAYGERAAILDGNVKRVLSRCYGVAEPALWKLAERLLPKRGIEAYTQGLMDLGATVCKRRVPACAACPVKGRCVARKTGRIAELPAARARKAWPWRQASWFVFIHQGKVLLERRPAPGIWGGLWSFPERRPANCRVQGKLPVIEHGFTHFRLRIRPLLCAGPPPAGRWLDLEDARRAAIPAPVRNLLQDLVA